MRNKSTGGFYGKKESCKKSKKSYAKNEVIRFRPPQILALEKIMNTYFKGENLTGVFFAL